MNDFSELEFRAKVDSALDTVRRLLDTTKHPVRAADVAHTYADKFALVESATSAALTSVGTAFEALGMTSATLDSMRKWVAAQKVSCHGISLFFFSLKPVVACLTRAFRCNSTRKNGARLSKK
jgi:hypothetical protein